MPFGPKKLTDEEMKIVREWIEGGAKGESSSEVAGAGKAVSFESRDAHAFSKLVDKLLDRPQYGERWARLWLDVVRYGESNGYERDGAKPHAWRYRDYVIDSFNRDKPFDRFITEQLAGDEHDANGHGHRRWTSRCVEVGWITPIGQS